MRSSLLAVIVSLHQCIGFPPTCYEYSGTVSPDFPCNPDAAVSSCCSAAWNCQSNLYCQTSAGKGRVGTCTQRDWSNPACPFSLQLGFDWPNTFSYTLNTTFCHDGTICPFPNNTDCCDHGDGITEIRFNNANPLPSKTAGLNTYYAAAGYTVPNAPATQTVFVSAKPDTAKGAATSGGHQPQQTGSVGSTGLSSGAKAGIGVGVPIGVTLLACLLYALIRRSLKRHRQVADQGGLSTTIEDPEPKPELAAESALGEMDATSKAEMVHELSSPEAPSVQQVHELSSPEAPSVQQTHELPSPA